MNNALIKHYDHIQKLVNEQNQELKLASLTGHTIIFIVDMTNGFCHSGNLASGHIQKIISPIKTLVQHAIANKIKIVAFTDAHNLHSPEFDSYPQHCLEQTPEAELVAELQHQEIKVINKNSTNSFFAFDFKPNLQWDNIIIVGCCTDICIYQFALSCKTWFNQHNKKVNVYVPKNLTTTFEQPDHDPTIANNLAWYSMAKNGVKIVKTVA